MPLKKDACKVLGELLISGFKGLELSESTSTWITRANIGGVLLFAHNYENPAQVAELTNQVQDCRQGRAPLWISVDQEGGRVQRFKKGFTRIPDAAAISAMESPKLTFEIAEVIARELSGVGINLNFCPIADIMTNPKNPVIGNRAFGTTEEVVSKMVTAMVRGHLTNGVQPCLKHFPGHGDTSTDSHFALPRVDVPLETLKEREFKPFLKGIKAKCSMIMTAHIVNPNLDEKVPATLSKNVLQTLLRQDLRYDGLIVSDDMDMKAISDHFGAEEAPVMALEAGCDLLIYRTQETAEIAYDACIRAIENGSLTSERVLQSAAKSQLLKKKFFPQYQPVTISDVGKFVGTPENLAVVQMVK